MGETGSAEVAKILALAGRFGYFCPSFIWSGPGGLAHNKTKRRFLPNLHYHRFWVESEKRWVRLRLSTDAMRLIDKKGIDAVLADMRERGVKV